jgi:hypothetical protein
MLGNERIDHRPTGGQAAHRPVLVRPHQPGVFGDVGGEDRRQPALDMRRHSGGLPCPARQSIPSGNAERPPLPIN